MQLDLMSKFDEYSRSYKFLKLERRDGILQMTAHTDGGPLQWGLEPQGEFARAFAEVGADRENRIVIFTGTGNEFSGPRLDPDAQFFHGAQLTPAGVHQVFWNAQRLVHSLLDIEVPMIAAVNGPAKRHADLALMCDGINVVYTLLMGLNRARYLMLTGQVLTAREAKDLGLVAELMPREQLLPRAWELASQLAKKSDMLLRYTRKVLTHPLRRAIDDGLQYYLAMEALSTLDKSQR